METSVINRIKFPFLLDGDVLKFDTIMPGTVQKGVFMSPLKLFEFLIAQLLMTRLNSIKEVGLLIHVSLCIKISVTSWSVFSIIRVCMSVLTSWSFC